MGIFICILLIILNLYVGFHGKMDPLNILSAGFCIGCLTTIFIDKLINEL